MAHGSRPGWFPVSAHTRGTVVLMSANDPIRVLHTFAPEFGWHFTSPDVDGMVGGGATYNQSRDRAEYLVRVHLASNPEPEATDSRTADTVRFAHFIDEQTARARKPKSDASRVTPPV